MAQLGTLNAKLTADGSNFNSTMKLAAFNLNKLESQQRAAKRAAEEHANSTESLMKKYQALRMETDANYASMQRYEKAAATVNQVAKAQKWSTEQLNAELRLLANHYGVAAQQGFGFNESVRSARFHSANLAAQFNDIGVMLASGQSPFILAMQQGTQISQVFNAMGGTVKEQMKVLGSSFMSIINPTSLLTIGVIAGVAALVQWGLAASGSAEKAEALKASQERLKGIVDGLTEATKKLRLEQQMAQSGATLEAQQLALNEVVALERMRAEKLAEIERLQDSIGGKAGFYAAREAKEKAASLQADIDKINVAIRQNEYQTQLDIAARRRANEFRNELREQKRFQDLVNASAKELESIYATLANSDLTGPIWALLAPFDAAIAKAKELANLSGMASGPAGPAQVPSGLGPEVGTLFGNVPEALGGGTVMGSSPRPRSAPAGTGGFEWGAGNGQGGGGGGGSVADKIQKELESIQQSLLTQEQMEMESYQRRLEVLKQSLDQQLITKQQYTQMMEQVESSHSFAMLKQSNNNARGVLGSLQTVFQGSKKIGAAIALANSYLAFTEVLKDPFYIGRPFARFAAAAAALSSGLQAVRSIKSAQPGGSGGGSISTGTGAGSDTGGVAARQTDVAISLTGGDLFDRKQVISLINAINQASEDGARIRLA